MACTPCPDWAGRFIFWEVFLLLRLGFADYADLRHGERDGRQAGGAAERQRCRFVRLSLIALAVSLVCMVSVSNVAFADSSGRPDEVISGPSQVPFTDLYGASVAAYDRYLAAALIFGYDNATVKSWSDDVKAKLSNPTSGGSFYTFANNCVVNYFDVTNQGGFFWDYIQWMGGNFWNVAETVYGNHLWAVLYSSDEYNSALTDLRKILAGENLGGNEPVDGEYFVYNFKPMGANFLDANKLYVPKDSFTYAAAWGDNLPVSGYLGFISSSPTSLSFNSLGFFDDASATYTIDSTADFYHYFNVTNAHGYHGNIANVTMYVEQRGTSLYVTGVSKKVYIYYNNEGTKKFSISASGGDGTAVFNGETSGGGNPVVPPTNWPDEPSAPSPPELPEPGTNPTVTPTPWAPVISPTFDFDLNITTEPTSNDLIDWVKKIYFELRTFHTDAQDWFDEVGKGIDGVVKAVDDAQKQIYSELQTIDDTLRDEGQKLRDYIYQMFHWLKDQLNFQNDSFNDSNIVYWLKRIWSKLGNGDINLRPTDPTTDPTGVWDWLMRLLSNILGELSSGIADLVSGVTDVVETVAHKFPFSIPWDIALFLGALVTSPVTPVFTFTVPSVFGMPSYDIAVDFTPYNDMAALVRLMTKFVFAGYLVWRTRDLLEMMDITSWG